VFLRAERSGNDNGELIPLTHNPDSFSCVSRHGAAARTIPRRLASLFIYLRSKHVTTTPEAQSQIEQPESADPTTRSARKTILAWSIFALGLNATAAVYTLSPADFSLPDVSRLAALFPHQSASAPIPDPVVAVLKDIQSAQQQHVASLQQNNSSLQQNTALLQQDSLALVSLRQSITDERVDVKKISAQITDEHSDVRKISAQISALTAKVDSLQNAIAPEITSSIPKGRARNRLTGGPHKRMAREPKSIGPVSSAPVSSAPASVGPVSVGGAPLNSTGGVPAGFPAFTPVPKS
jgi:cell division protein FtsB